MGRIGPSLIISFWRFEEIFLSATQFDNEWRLKVRFPFFLCSRRGHGRHSRFYSCLYICLGLHVLALWLSLAALIHFHRSSRIADPRACHAEPISGAKLVTAPLVWKVAQSFAVPIVSKKISTIIRGKTILRTVLAPMVVFFYENLANTPRNTCKAP